MARVWETLSICVRGSLLILLTYPDFFRCRFWLLGPLLGIYTIFLFIELFFAIQLRLERVVAYYELVDRAIWRFSGVHLPNEESNQRRHHYALAIIHDEDLLASYLTFKDNLEPVDVVVSSDQYPEELTILTLKGCEFGMIEVTVEIF